MTAVVYEFEKICFNKQKNYIFQLVKDRKLTDIYHSHDFYEWIYCLRGSGTQCVNGREQACEKGVAVLLRPNDTHCFLAQTEDIEVLSLSVKKEEFVLFSGVYDPELLACIQKSENPVHFAFPAPFATETYQGEGAKNITEYDCKFLLSCFLKGYIEATDCLQSGSRLPRMLSYAIGEMKKTENLRRGISAFTELSHYSQSHLSRLIKKHFGRSLKAYINELRLQSAYNEIILTRKEVEEISETLGFASFSHFNKIFKARFSVTPASLRKNKGVWTA